MTSFYLQLLPSPSCRTGALQRRNVVSSVVLPVDYTSRKTTLYPCRETWHKNFPELYIFVTLSVWLPCSNKAYCIILYCRPIVFVIVLFENIWIVSKLWLIGQLTVASASFFIGYARALIHQDSYSLVSHLPVCHIPIDFLHDYQALQSGAETQGGQREIVPLKYLGGGDGGAFIPQCLENVIANCHSERDWEGEKQKIRHQWPTHVYWFIGLCRNILWYCLD